MTTKVYKLTPSLVSKVWGGSRLETIRGLSETPIAGPIGETWEVSTHADGPCKVGEDLLKNLLSRPLDYLVKFIDTKDYLSVQVHPNDEYAARVENSSGKTECWLILDAGEGDGIYLGLEKDVTEESFREALENGSDMSKLLTFYPVKRGDFFFVPAGSVHAIGKNVFLAEVQQSSGITYRVWDWNRMGMDGKPRELHVEKAMDVINFDPAKNSTEYFRVRRNLLDIEGEFDLISHSHFNMKLVHTDSASSWSFNSNGRPCSLLCLDGEVSVNGVEKAKAYQAMLIPSEEKISFEVSTDRNASFLIIT